MSNRTQLIKLALEFDTLESLIAAADPHFGKYSKEEQDFVSALRKMAGKTNKHARPEDVCKEAGIPANLCTEIVKNLTQKGYISSVGQGMVQLEWQEK